MADKGREEDSPPLYQSFSQNRRQRDDLSDSDSDEISARPDLFNENVANVERLSHITLTNSVTGEQPKREENPFSFKHFLRNDTSTSSPYQHMGARPKVYTNNRDQSHNSSDTSHSNASPLEGLRLPSTEFPSVLPDFVQDHLVVEQCYLGIDSHSDVDNLPDFTINRPPESQNIWSETGFNNSGSDLTYNLTHESRDKRRTRVADFPLDLPLITDPDYVSNSTSTSGSRSCPHTGEVGVSKSLPDFLSDGPIHSNRLSEASSTSNESSNLNNGCHRSEQQMTENDRLREELEVARRQLSEQSRQIEALQRDMAAMKRKEQKYMHSLSKSMELVEGNLHKTNERAVSAESTVYSLTQEIKKLTEEITSLKRENRILQDQSGAVGGPCIIQPPMQTQRLAQELRGAANTAEHSLRQLLTGLGNLRAIATSLENLQKCEEQSESFLSDFEDEPGPAL